jgi:hypothetical protein
MSMSADLLGHVVPIIEILTALVGMAGLIFAFYEIAATRALADVASIIHSERRRLIASHQVYLEIKRCGVHLLVTASALAAILLPEPPRAMEDWMRAVIAFRHFAFLAIAIIATMGTYSARVLRLRLAELL